MSEPDSSNISRLLLEGRRIFLFKDITSDSTEDIMSKLILLDSISNDPIEFYICSPGGNVDEGLAIYDLMKLLPSPIHTYAMGCVASFATVLLAAGDKR